jgi:hypothetical protein
VPEVVEGVVEPVVRRLALSLRQRLDLAEPAEKSIRQPMRDAVRQQKTDVLPQHGFGGCRSHCHISVKNIE